MDEFEFSTLPLSFFESLSFSVGHEFEIDTHLNVPRSLFCWGFLPPTRLRHLESLDPLAWLYEDARLGAAEEAVPHAIPFSRRKAKNFTSINPIVSFSIHAIPMARGRIPFTITRYPLELHPLLNVIINCFELITPWRSCFDKSEFHDAHIHVEQINSHADDCAYEVGPITQLRARIWYRQCRLEG